MEKKHIQMAILRQEQTFRQQVHELHRVYQVQKQLMIEMQVVATKRAHATGDARTQWMMGKDRQQWFGRSGERKASSVEGFDLELKLATGGGSRKQEMPSNSYSGVTLSSSTSAESELGRRFPETTVKLSFQNENKRHDESAHAVSLALPMFKSEDGMIAYLGSA